MVIPVALSSELERSRRSESRTYFLPEFSYGSDRPTRVISMDIDTFFELVNPVMDFRACHVGHNHHSDSREKVRKDLKYTTLF